MEHYTKLCRDIILEHINDRLQYNKINNINGESRDDILAELLEDTEDIFGNISGSRTCNTWEAEQELYEARAIFDDEIRELFEELGDDYFTITLERGPETLDVVILELLAPRVVSELKNEINNKVEV